MALANIDYEKVDPRLLSLLQQIHSFESIITGLDVNTISGVADMIANLDGFRNNIALEIERQGKR
jgi:hypothetical protein